MDGSPTPVPWRGPEGDHLHSDSYYRAQWRAYALRRNLALAFSFSWPVVALGLFWVSRNYNHQPILSLTLIFLWLATAVALVYWSGEFRCPRCRRRYGALGHGKGDTNLTRGIFDKICSNCKLRKFERVP